MPGSPTAGWCRRVAGARLRSEKMEEKEVENREKKETFINPMEFARGVTKLLLHLNRFFLTV